MTDITIQDSNKDMPSSPSLAKLLKTDMNGTGSRQQHFDSGGGLMDGGGDSWGSISKMLHQRYNTGGGSTDSTGEKHVTEHGQILPS